MINEANSIRDASKILKVSIQTIYNEINSGRLKTYKIGRRRFVSADALHKYIKDRETEAV
jgi:excisionase family DNA binding protein